MHNQKYKSGASKAVLKHIFRIHPGSKSDIDPERTHLNYSLFNSATAAARNIDYFETQKDVVGVRRKDQVTLIDSVLTLPKELLSLNENDMQQFFISAGNFLIDRYCKESQYCVAAQVHMDETTPHMHFAWLPVKDGKFNANAIMTRRDLSTLHTDLENYLVDELPFVEPGMIKNGNTTGVKTVEHLKQQTALKKETEQLQKKKQQLESELAEKQATLAEVSEQVSHNQRILDNQIDQINENNDRLAAITSKARQAQEEYNSLLDKLNSLKRAILSDWEPLKNRISQLAGRVNDLLFNDFVNEYNAAEKDINSSFGFNFDPETDDIPDAPKKKPKSR